MGSQAQELLRRLAQSRDCSRAAAQWLEQARVERRSHAYVLHVGSVIQKRWLETRMGDALADALGGPVEIVASSGTSPEDAPRPRVRPRLHGPAGAYAVGMVRAFIEGGPAAASLVVLHGPAHCGKSLLMDWAASLSPRRVFILDMERLKGGRSRGLVPRKPLVVGDGVERLVGRPGAQRTLCAMIDAVTDRGDRLLLAIEGHPGHAGTILPALRNRLTGGVLVPLEEPTPSDVREQLKDRARSLGVRLPEEWEQELAGLPPAAALRALDMRLGLAAETDGSHDLAGALERMKDTAARIFGISRDGFESTKRRRSIVEARRAIMAAAHAGGVAERAIAEAFGLKSVRSVREACRWAEREQERDPRFGAVLHELGRVLPKE